MKEIGNWGGYILNPPEECKYKIKAPDEGIWTDLGCCQANCKDHCDRFKKFEKQGPKERHEYLISCGVNLPPWGGIELPAEEAAPKKEWEKEEPQKECKYKRREG